MTEIYQMELYQGEAFYREFVLRDEAGEYEDLTNATPSVQISSGITEANITVAKTGEPGSISLSSLAAVTALWPAGTFDIQLILTWSPVETVDVEQIVAIKLTVKEAI